MDEPHGLYAEPMSVEEPPPGRWYHMTDVPGHGTIDGKWDFRHCTAAYLGDYDFAGKRVLEIGPASGHLTFWMEDQGAEVVAIDVPDDYRWDVVPGTAQDQEETKRHRTTGQFRQRQCWWFQHQIRNSKARAAYTGAYNLPEELGQFDVAVLAAVLIHLRHPFDAIEAAARRADTLIIAQRHLERIERTGRPVAEFQPAADNDIRHSWWIISSAALRRMVGLLGYEVIHETTANPIVRQPGATRVPEVVEVRTSTLVAQRPGRPS